jgi:hypothetical protein
MSLKYSGWVLAKFFVHFLAMYLRCAGSGHHPLPPVGPTRSHTQNPVHNCRVMNFRDECNTPPGFLNTIKPNVVEFVGTVVVDIKIADLRVQVRGRRLNIFQRTGAIP